MSRDTLLIEGSLPDYDPRAELEAENRKLRRELADAQIEASRAREDANRALSRLRTQLSPLYRALQMVFGELAAAGVDDGPTTSTAAPSSPSGDRISPVWEAWKQRLTPACGKIIDALLIHKELNGQQLCVAAQMAKKTMYDSITRLNKAGVLNKAGGRFSLKQL